MAINDIEQAYDTLPYTSQSFKELNPQKLEAIARLISLNPIPTSNARVLEIGCSFGGNLIPFALNNKNADVVGIDLSGIQISKGQKIIEDIGISNLKLYQKDICDLKDELGKFDYIIVHGVYSWVPKNVQKSILSVIKNLLTPNGLAFISYNVYPGWKGKSVLRDFINIFVQNSHKDASELEKVTAFRENIKSLKDYIRTLGLEDKQRWLIKHIDSVNEKYASMDYYLYHEFFEIFNDPCYFFEFVKDIEKFELGYLTDTNLHISLDTLYDEQICGIFSSIKDIPARIVKEQYIDFAINSSFRRSIITHAQNIQNARLDKRFDKKSVNALYIRGKFDEKDGSIIDSKERIVNPKTTKIVDVINSAYPGSVNIEELVTKFEDKNEVYSSIIAFILNGSVDILPVAVKCIKYAPGKSKIKEIYERYIRYFLKDDEPAIGFSNQFNEIILSKFDKADLEIMLEFNGKNSIKDIKNIIKKRGITMQRKDKKGNIVNVGIGEAADIYLEGLIKMMTNSLMFEEI
jgi:methyltransferase